MTYREDAERTLGSLGIQIKQPRYYGTAVKASAGAPREGQPNLRPPALSAREWCEEAACPRDECVVCRKRTRGI